MKKEKLPCRNCALRAKYDKKPKSLLGRIWHWHTGFCPGWKAFMESLEPEERELFGKKYGRGKSQQA